ncbi:hypothetical protein STEG23_004469, partial [Scotinomys teguina]
MNYGRLHKKKTSTSASGHKVTDTSASGHKVTSTSASGHKVTDTSASGHKVTDTSASAHKVTSTSASGHKVTSTSASGHKVTSTSASGHKVTNTSASGHKVTNTKTHSFINAPFFHSFISFHPSIAHTIKCTQANAFEVDICISKYPNTAIEQTFEPNYLNVKCERHIKILSENVTSYENTLRLRNDVVKEYAVLETISLAVGDELLQGQSPKPNTRELLQPGSGGGMMEQSSGDCDDEDGCGGSGSGEVKRTLKITN